VARYDDGAFSSELAISMCVQMYKLTYKIDGQARFYEEGEGYDTI
jgi:hypothetical protein